MKYKFTLQLEGGEKKQAYRDLGRGEALLVMSRLANRLATKSVELFSVERAHEVEVEEPERSCGK